MVRELTIAANIPMPKVYIIDDTAPNAFATGRDPKHASIAITTGLLQKLTREELQGVIGHELSHVRNYDIRFTLIVGVLVGSIALLADFFLRFTFWGGMSDREDSNDNPFGIVLVIFGFIAIIFAPIVAQLLCPALVERHQFWRDAPLYIATLGLHSSRSQVSPIRLCPKLRCGSLATSVKPAF